MSDLKELQELREKIAIEVETGIDWLDYQTLNDLAEFIRGNAIGTK
jgi:hypothetical protein